MFQSVSVFIGLRYANAKKGSGFLSFISFFTTAGILLGIMALILVVSVMNGFEGQLKTRILGIVPHVIATPNKALPSSPDKSQLMSPVTAEITPYWQAEVVLQSTKDMRLVQVQGIDSDAAPSYLSQSMEMGSINQLQAKQFGVVIGKTLSYEMQLDIGSQIRLIAPEASIFTPMGRVPSQRLFTVTGIFDTGSEIDGTVIYAAHADLAKLLRQPLAQVTAYRVQLHDAYLLTDYFNYLPKDVTSQWQFSTWQQSQGKLFGAVQMEKRMMGLLLTLIILVAAFNIISALMMMVNDKTSEIAILKTLGLNANGISHIFVIQGMRSAIVGSVLGAGLGLLLAHYLNPVLNVLGISILGPNMVIPVIINYLQITSIIVLTWLVTLLSCIYPARKAAAVEPASVLRYE